MKIGIIGGGTIGRELYRRAQQFAWDIRFVLKKDGFYRNLTEKIDNLKAYRGYAKNLDVAFCAIPTTDNGKTAFDYLSFFLSHGIPVVTCEKGALANYFFGLRKFLNRVGYNATVGGGTRMLPYVKEMVGPTTTAVHVVINGTLNFVMNELSRGRSFEDAVSAARKLGYAEPGGGSPRLVLNTEAILDVPKKTAIILNVCGLSSEVVKADDIDAAGLDEKSLARIAAEPDRWRYIVSFVKDSAWKTERIGGFEFRAGEWTVIGGFQNIGRNPLLAAAVPSGVNNRVMVCEGRYSDSGTFILSGPGAGAKPTVTSMIKDALLLVT